MPEVYNAFFNGEFSVQMGEANPLVATKQTKLSKTPSTETVTPEVATSALVPILQQHSIGCQMHLAEEHTEITEGTFIDQKYVHKELAPGRIRKDIEDVEKGINLLENVLVWRRFNSTDVGATAEVS